jgi:uncharacterized protein
MAVWKLVLVAVAGGLAGILNSVAGGGTLITYPALVALGRDPIVANATSTLALWPGYVAAAVGFRREVGGARRWVALLSIPSLAGGLVGAFLLLRTPSDTFSFIVPFLVLGATVVLAFQVRRPPPERRRGPWAPVGAIAFQLVAAVYGGYFGAGLGFMLLAGFGLMGLRDMLEMSGLKNALTVLINGIALGYFVASGAVRWVDGLVMAGGAAAGGFGGTVIARRVGDRIVRRAVVVIGIAVAIGLLVKALA